MSELFVEHGLGPVSELSPHCGRYEFKDNGDVVAWDALVSSRTPEQILSVLATRNRGLTWSHPTDGVWFTDRNLSGKEQHIQVHASSAAKLPQNCRALGNGVRTVVVVAEAL